MSGSSSFLVGGGRAEAEVEGEADAEVAAALKARSRSSSSSFFSCPVSVVEEVATRAEEVDEEEERREPARLRTGAAVGGKPRG